MACVLYIGKVWPEPASSAAGTRTLQLLTLLSSRYSEVFFASAAARTNDSLDITSFGVKPLSITLNDDSFNAMVADLRPDVVIFDRFVTEEQFGWRVAESCAGAARILDTQDLHGLREARRLAAVADVQETDPFLHNEIAYREIASIYRSDLTLVISGEEMRYLRDVFGVPDHLCIYTPYLFKKLGGNKKSPGFDERNGFVFIGNFRHDPNADAALYLKRTIWPRIRELLPAARVDVYGAYAPRAIMSLHDPSSGFMVHGRAQSADKVFESARVSLAPLRYGAGLKGKVVESWRCGTPCVATGIAAEGLAPGKWSGAVTDDPEMFARAAAQLHETREEWQRANSWCVPAHDSIFDGELHAEQLLTRISHVVQHLTELRRRNYTGAMLVHQNNHASRWLGRFIEIKTKLQHAADREN